MMPDSCYVTNTKIATPRAWAPIAGRNAKALPLLLIPKLVIIIIVLDTAGVYGTFVVRS